MELHARPAGLLQPGQGGFGGQHHHHAPLLGKAHRAREVEITDAARSVFVEEGHAAAILEAVFHGLFFAADDLHDEAVERVVIAAAQRHRAPAFAPPRQAVEAHRFGGPAEGRFLIFVFQLEQFALARQ